MRSYNVADGNVPAAALIGDMVTFSGLRQHHLPDIRRFFHADIRRDQAGIIRPFHVAGRTGQGYVNGAEGAVLPQVIAIDGTAATINADVGDGVKIGAIRTKAVAVHGQYKPVGIIAQAFISDISPDDMPAPERDDGRED